MKKLFAALLAFSAYSVSAQDVRSPWLDWVVANSPHGFDITPDGTIWINLAEVGRKDDYAIRAQDLQIAREESDSQPDFWVRGYHKRNPDVAYRESKALFWLDCQRVTMGRKTIAFYSEDGTLLSRLGAGSTEYIIPGTYGAEYHRLICLVD